MNDKNRGHFKHQESVIKMNSEVSFYPLPSIHNLFTAISKKSKRIVRVLAIAAYLIALP